MKIKIPAQAKKTIPNDALNRDVKPITKEITDLHKDISNNLILIVGHKTGEKKVYQSLAVNVNDKKYFSVLANPIHLFLSTAIEMYELSEIRKSINFPKCGKKDNNSNLFLLEFEPGYTHECYNDFIKARITSIIMLVSAIESFMNQQLTLDFKYQTKGKKSKEFDIETIEKKIFFKEKIEDVLPKAIKREGFWKTEKDTLKVLHNLYEQRKTFIHLKTHSEDELLRYSIAFEKMIEFDLLEAINYTIKFMNLVEENFIEVELSTK
ncbi:MAG: hypothetical protein K0B10_12100 [Vicingaceae bacterium]|nr:hypothetical protein [Vicingaceae bacterium]